jgi:hypothetical protein
MTWIFACWYLWMLRMLVIFSGIFECISYLLDNFSPVWPIVDFLWDMFSFDLGNPHALLDGLEIWHVNCRHLKVCHGFSPIHLSCVVTVLWFIEVGACFDALYEFAWTCFDFLIFIDLLPLIQMSWNFVWLWCYGWCLIMNYLRHFWIVCDWIWVESFCWLLWASICHALT